MVLGLQPNPAWAEASGHPTAIAQGLWAGALAIVVLTFGGLLGDFGIILAIAVTAVATGSFLVLAPVDILAKRRASDARLTAAVAVVALFIVLWYATSFVLPGGLPMPPQPNDAYEVAFPTVAGLLLAAERFAARGHLAWRDRAIAAAASYLVVGGVFLLGAEWVSWAILLAALTLRLPANARIALAVLSGAAALGLGQYVAGTWTARAVEAAAFVAYALASLALVRLRPSQPTATSSLA